MTGWDDRKESMHTHERSVQARSLWQPGPWSSEPDRIEWRTEAGYPGIINRAGGRHLCGYVGVEPGHPWHGKALDEYAKENDAIVPTVHGGVTYARECEGDVCHVPAPGEPEHLWWVGFDAMHCDDAAPLTIDPSWRRFTELTAASGVYRDVAYMRAQVERCAAQAKRVANGETLDGEMAETDVPWIPMLTRSLGG